MVTLEILRFYGVKWGEIAHPEVADSVELVVALVDLKLCSKIVLDAFALLFVQLIQQALVRQVEALARALVHALNSYVKDLRRGSLELGLDRDAGHV